MAASPPIVSTAAQFEAELRARATDAQREKYRRFFTFGPDEEFVGVPMGEVFALAKRALALGPEHLEQLLRSPVHEVRAGACSAMGKSAAHPNATDARRAELFALYLRRHDRINNWDLVDLAAAPVVGGHLFDRDRGPLRDLALDDFWPRRRTAVVAAAHFIRRGQVADTFALAEQLVRDPHPLVQKGVGWMLRYAGDTDRPALLGFLDRHAAAMPRVMLRYAAEKLPPEQRKDFAGRR